MMEKGLEVEVNKDTSMCRKNLRETKTNREELKQE